jgi:predicted GTPase
MKRWQIITLGVLLLVPTLLYVGWGGYALWRIGGLGYFGWALPLCWTIAYWLARRWQPKAPPEAVEPATHWTARDEAAWEIVLRRARGTSELTAEQLLDPHQYLTSAQDLALEVARHYHPEADDPLGPLTVPEVMAAAELALRDTSQWVRDYVPGSHLLRIDHWRMLAEAPRWAKIAGNAWSIGAVLLNPADIVRQLITRFSLNSASKELQTGLLAGFHAVFVQRAGFYLIEVHSGRLRLGADHYLEAQRRFGPASPHAKITRPLDRDNRSAPETRPDPSTVSPRESTTTDEPSPANAQAPAAAGDPALRIVVVGQAKAGKSSLINALIGESTAAVDILPCTRELRRYRMTLGPTDAPLALLDSPGYGDDGLTAAQLDEVYQALEDADALLLVMNATSPARNVDLKVLVELDKRLKARPERKRPPVIGVLTHMDGLRPVLEWDPPYDWREGHRLKEVMIREAVQYNREVLGDRVDAVIPVCTDVGRDRVYGLEQFLFPALVAQLHEVRACALLRHLHRDWDQLKIKQLWQQLYNIGRRLTR